MTTTEMTPEVRTIAPESPVVPVTALAGPRAPPRRVYDIVPRDGVFALLTFGIGYVWWDWLWPRSTPIVVQDSPTGGHAWFQDWLPAAGVPAFFVLALAVSIAYYRLSGVRLTLKAYAGAGAILLATGPFVLYSPTPFHVLLGAALIGAFLAWHALVFGAPTREVLGVALLTDGLNQSLAPFRNAGAWWAGLTRGLRGRRGPTQAVAIVVGLILAVPVLAGVVTLLASADDGFSHLVASVTDALAHLNLGRAFWEALFAIPVAMFAAGLLYANTRRTGTDTLTPGTLRRAVSAVRHVPAAAVVAPLAILCLLYVVFFAAMGTYAFSAFAGRLPDGFTYASFARRGFFELAGVAALNAAVVAFVHLLVARALPRVVRVLSATLCALTLLLVTTSISKMVLYVGTYGLTLLRLVTLVAMGGLFVVVALVLARHVRRFDVSRPILAVIIAGLLALTWGNPQGFIARWNVDAFLDGRTSHVDVDYLRDNLGDAAIPALADLARADGVDRVAAAQASAALADYRTSAAAIATAGGAPWMAWNWQRDHAVRVAEAAG